MTPVNTARTFFKLLKYGVALTSASGGVLAVLPFDFIHQASDDGTFNAKGLGDIAVFGNYKVLDHSSATAGKKLITQQLWLGAGIKLATGKFDIDPTEPEPLALANTQVGSGSNYFILNAMYNININSVGVNTSARYKINTTNNDKFFGINFPRIALLIIRLQNRRLLLHPTSACCMSKVSQ
ncbi:MAG: hypothetical protein ABIQ31_15515 [Ferruginibacter sp.]